MIRPIGERCGDEGIAPKRSRTGRQIRSAHHRRTTFGVGDDEPLVSDQQRGTVDGDFGDGSGVKINGASRDTAHEQGQADRLAEERPTRPDSLDHSEGRSGGRRHQGRAGPSGGRRRPLDLGFLIEGLLDLALTIR